MTRAGRTLVQMATALAFLAICACKPADKADETAPANTPIASGTPAAPRLPLGTGFDFYVLSLSWSPSYCEAEGADANPQQCATARPYAFVVHGLWPQFERGFPQNCGGRSGEVPSELVRTLFDIMPSSGLIRHEWRTHGTCSGLSQADYFKVLRGAREKIVIPPEFGRIDTYRTVTPTEVEQSFLTSNPGLSGEDITVTCDKRYLREVRLCLSKDLSFRTCPEIDRRGCRMTKAVMPPVRGG